MDRCVIGRHTGERCRESGMLFFFFEAMNIHEAFVSPFQAIEYINHYDVLLRYNIPLSKRVYSSLKRKKREAKFKNSYP